MNGFNLYDIIKVCHIGFLIGTKKEPKNKQEHLKIILYIAVMLKKFSYKIIDIYQCTFCRTSLFLLKHFTMFLLACSLIRQDLITVFLQIHS